MLYSVLDVWLWLVSELVFGFARNLKITVCILARAWVLTANLLLGLELWFELGLGLKRVLGLFLRFMFQLRVGLCSGFNLGY